MRMKKMSALIISAAMAFSAAVPVMAAEIPADQRIEASSGLWCRLNNASGTSGKWTTDSFMSIGADKGTEDVANYSKEIQWNQYNSSEEGSIKVTAFCAVYRFDLTNLAGYTTANLNVATNTNSNRTISVYGYNDGALPTNSNTNKEAQTMYSNVETAIAGTALGTGTYSSNAASIALNVSGLKALDTDNDSTVSLLITVTDASETQKTSQLKMYVDGSNRPYLSTTAPAAKVTLGSTYTYYDSLDAALTAAASGAADNGNAASIELYKDQTLGARVLLGGTGDESKWVNLKNLTIEGVPATEGGKITIDASNLDKLMFEASINSSASLTLKNVKLTPKGTNNSVGLKDGTTFVGENIDITNFEVCKVKSATVTNSTITNITMSNAEAKLTANNCTIGGTFTLKATPDCSNGGGYTFITGDNNSYPISSPDGYTFTDGKLTKIVTPALAAEVTKVEGFYGTKDGADDTSDIATAVTTKFSGGESDAVNLGGVIWTVGEKQYKAKGADTVSVTPNGSDVFYGLIINGVYATSATVTLPTATAE